MTDSIASNQTILVGGGISGMTAALEAAECGKQVILVERNATLGGRTMLMNRYFPKMCQPTCGLWRQFETGRPGRARHPAGKTQADRFAAKIIKILSK